MQASEIIRDDRGAERCHRIVKSVQNNKPIDAYCNTPVLFDITEKRKTCPNCEKRPPEGDVHPRTINSNGIVLSAGELKSLGLTENQMFKENPAPVQPKPKKPKEKKLVEGKVYKQTRDAVSLTVTLEQIEQTEDVAGLLIRTFLEGMQKLPTTNFAESKRLIRLEERLNKMLEA